MSPYDPEQKESKPQSVFGVIIHSFFVVPFLIAVFSVLLFAAVRLLTMEKQTVSDLLEEIKSGGATKRWQAAFELSKVLSNPQSFPTDENFSRELIKAFNQSEHDDNRVRQYLALAMGRTGKDIFIDPILTGLKNEKEENLYTDIYALGILRAKKAVPTISSYLDHSDSHIRLAAVMALGDIGEKQSINLLKKALNDSEPNVQWETSIALAKLNDASGRDILLKLLDRNYLSKFPEVDIQEQTHIVLTTIAVAANLHDPQITEMIKHLAETDQNMNVRKLAMSVFEKK